ncbi:MAG: TRAP transporter substrate-binding protein [Hyphomicrobiaceae bacterium]
MKSYNLGRRFSMATAAVALGILAGANPAMAQEKLIYATYFSEIYSASKTDNWFMSEVEKRSGGEMKFEKFWSQSLMKGTDLFPALKSGAADVANGSPAGYNASEYPLANILLPLTSMNADAVALAWNKLYANNADFRNEFESKGAKLIYTGPWAESSLWSTKPLLKASDYKGIKIRVTKPLSDAYVLLGATPIALTWPDGLEGLQRGVVDAMTGPFDSIVLGGAHEVAKYGGDGGALGVYALAVVGMSMDRYKRLSPKHRKIIDDVSAEALQVSLKNNDASVDKVVKKLCGMKDKVVIGLTSPEEREKIRKVAVAPLQDRWIELVKKQVHVDGRAMLDQFLGYVHEYEKTTTYVPGFERYLKTCGKN